MPELPEVETVVRTLRPHLLGRTITGLDVYWERTVSPHDPVSLRLAIVDNTIDDVHRRAKLIVLLLSSGCRLTVHLRMTGELLLRLPHDSTSSNTPDASYLRASVELDNGGTLQFHDIRKFGRIRLYSPSEWVQRDREFGIEPLSTEFSVKTLIDILGRHRRQMKPLLLDQTVIAGLGNIYVDEALFKARIHPLQLSHRVSRSKATALHEAIQATLRTAIDSRGTTLRNYRTGMGESGENRDRLLIYGKPAGDPCPRCGRALRRLTVGQRGTIFCSNCQRLRNERHTMYR